MENLTPEDKYLDYLDQHISGVNKAYMWLVRKSIIKDDLALREQIERHDESKYHEEEWDAYLNNFYIPEKADEMEFKYAWLHHQHNNPHHWQHWCLREDEGTELEALDMPYNYIIEMVCDWLAFSINKGDLKEIQKWYKENKDKQLLSKNTKEIVEGILNQIDKLS